MSGSPDSTGLVERLLDGGQHAPLNREGTPRDASAGGRAMTAPSENGGDIAHVHAIIFGTQTDTREFGLQLFENTGDDDRLDVTNMIDQSLA